MPVGFNESCKKKACFTQASGINGHLEWVSAFAHGLTGSDGNAQVLPLLWHNSGQAITKAVAIPL